MITKRIRSYIPKLKSRDCVFSNPQPFPSFHHSQIETQIFIWPNTKEDFQTLTRTCLISQISRVHNYSHFILAECTSTITKPQTYIHGHHRTFTTLPGILAHYH